MELTKILYIPTGEYVKFLSSVSYDISHPENITERVIDYENSYVKYRYVWSIEKYIQEIINSNKELYIPEIDKQNLEFSREEFEIIYD